MSELMIPIPFRELMTWITTEYQRDGSVFGVHKPYTPFSDANIDGHMIFGMTGRQCQTTMINGKILMKDRVLTEIDEEAVNAHVLESAKRLWGKLNHCEY